MAPRSRLGRRVVTFLSLGAVLGGVAEPSLAQDKPAPIIEAVIGRSGFIDEVWDHFTTVGGGARVFVTPRLAIGPEVAYLKGEYDALDASNVTVTGNITFDFVRDERRARFIPYFAAGAGYVRQKTLVGSGPGSTALAPFTSGEVTMSAGVGVRIAVASRVFIAPEFRLGWEPETRLAVMLGMRTR
jgi:opacity protein-like surface antigen